MIKIQKDNFNIRQICNSGQCFRMEEIEKNRFSVIAGGKYIEIEQRDLDILFICEKEDFAGFWSDYFDFDTDYGSFINSIQGDQYLKNAANHGTGIRILRQDLWEMIITFIISQQNNIKRIRKCIVMLCEKYGEKKQDFQGKDYYDFPTVHALSTASEEDLRNLNLGYRSKYIVKTTKSILEDEVNLTNLSQLEYLEAKQELMKLTGVGEKVAECICLFGLHHMDAFPVDTHIKQVFDSNYPDGFPYEKYKGFAGVIQQYIFYYDLFQMKNMVE